jgi:hypothetical protein
VRATACNRTAATTGPSTPTRMNGWRVGPHFPGTRDEHGHPVMDGLVKQRNRIFCLSIAVDGFHDPRIRAYPGVTCSMRHTGAWRDHISRGSPAGCADRARGRRRISSISDRSFAPVRPLQHAFNGGRGAGELHPGLNNRPARIPFAPAHAEPGISGKAMVIVVRSGVVKGAVASRMTETHCLRRTGKRRRSLHAGRRQESQPSKQNRHRLPVSPPVLEIGVLRSRVQGHRSAS